MLSSLDGLPCLVAPWLVIAFAACASDPPEPSGADAAGREAQVADVPSSDGTAADGGAAADAGPDGDAELAPDSDLVPDVAASPDAAESPDAGAPSISAFPGPTMGRVLGLVVDVETSAVVATATVSTSSTSTVTGSDGVFDLAMSAGAVVLDVRASGYLPWSGTVPASDPPAFEHVYLKRRAAPATVTPAGGLLASGDARLTFAAGTYPGDAEVRATWVSGAELSALSAPVMFLEGSESRMVRSAIDVEGPQPGQPVTVELPVPPGVTATSGYALYTYDPVLARWRDPIAPTQVAAGIATFSLASFSTHGLIGPMLTTHYWVLNVEGTVHFTGASSTLLRGWERIPLQGTITTERGSSARIMIPGRGRLRVLPSTELQLGPLLAQFRLPSTGRVYLDEHIAVSNNPATCVTLETGEATVEAACNVHSSFFLQRVTCPSAAPYTGIIVEQGQVTMTPPGGSSRVIGADQQSYSCYGCALLPFHEAPSCCNAQSCPSGCCTAVGLCAPGTERGECGAGGALCDHCGFRACAQQICAGPCNVRNAAPCANGDHCVDGVCEACARTDLCDAAVCGRDGAPVCCLATGCGQSCGRCTEADEQCGNGLDDDQDGLFDEGASVRIQSDQRIDLVFQGCARCTVNDDCPRGNQEQGGQFCQQNAGGGYCADCPPEGCRYCSVDADCGEHQFCSSQDATRQGACFRCARECVPGSVICQGPQCINVCDSLLCLCSAEFGNGCATRLTRIP